jgi:hypothetical protein
MYAPSTSGWHNQMVRPRRARATRTSLALSRAGGVVVARATAPVFVRHEHDVVVTPIVGCASVSAPRGRSVMNASDSVSPLDKRTGDVSACGRR